MKILHVISDGYLCGGAEKSVVMLRDGLAARGHEVRIMSSDLGPTDELFSDYVFPHIKPGFGSFTRHLYYRPARRCLDQALRDFAPDVVHLHTLGELSPAVPLGLRDTPTVLTVHGPEEYIDSLVLWYQPSSDFRNGQITTSALTLVGRARYLFYTKLQKPLYRRAFRHLSAIIAPSRYMAAEIDREHFGPLVRQIYNGATLPSPGPQRQTYQLLYVGRLESVKGLDYLIKALSSLKQQFETIRLTIIGEGRERIALEALVRDLDLADQVEFVGWQESSAVELAYQQAAVVVIPSVWPENLPTVAIEAQGAGRPIVATNVGGVGEIVGDAAGMIVPPADAEALASAIAQILSDPKLAQAMSDAAVVSARRFEIDTFVSKIEELYEEVAA